MIEQIPTAQAPRRRWMAVLARAGAADIAAHLADCGTLPPHTIIRGPEDGLVMVRGRIGGGGGAFNLGEMTVTRCSVHLEGGTIGHAYVTGRDRRQAELAALADALMQLPSWNPIIETRVIAPLEQAQETARVARATKAATTQVQFFAMQTTRS